MITITPASLDMVVAGRGGQRITIDNDVCGVAQQLREIDERMALQYSPEGNYFMVVLLGAAAHGRPHLVTTCQELHGGLVEHVRRLASPGYDAGQALETIDKDYDREVEHRFKEQVGEVSERLSHAIKSDLKKGRPGPTYIPPDAY